MCLLRWRSRSALATIPCGGEAEHFDIESRHHAFFRWRNRLGILAAINAYITTAGQRASAVGLPRTQKNRLGAVKSQKINTVFPGAIGNRDRLCRHGGIGKSKNQQAGHRVTIDIAHHALQRQLRLGREPFIDPPPLLQTDIPCLSFLDLNVEGTTLRIGTHHDTVTRSGRPDDRAGGGTHNGAQIIFARGRFQFEVTIGR